jgi:hypothetical protein
MRNSRPSAVSEGVSRDPSLQTDCRQFAVSRRQRYSPTLKCACHCCPACLTRPFAAGNLVLEQWRMHVATIRKESFRPAPSLLLCDSHGSVVIVSAACRLRHGLSSTTKPRGLSAASTAHRNNPTDTPLR